MVSRGRSHRLRVGFDRSGSAGEHMSARSSCRQPRYPQTNRVPHVVPVLNGSNRRQRGSDTTCHRSYRRTSVRARSMVGRRFARSRRYSHGSASMMAKLGSAFVVNRFACFSSCVSVRSILWSLPLLFCEWLERKLKLDFARCRC